MVLFDRWHPDERRTSLCLHRDGNQNHSHLGWRSGETKAKTELLAAQDRRNPKESHYEVETSKFIIHLQEPQKKI